MKLSQQVDQLNQQCLCFPLQRQLFLDYLTDKLPSLSDTLSTRDHLFAGTGILVTQSDVNSMLDVIKAVEALVKLPRYQSFIFSRSEVAAFWQNQSTTGLLMGYDFHISSDGPKLIEINTNAGGAFLASPVQVAAQQVYPGCCDFGPLSFPDSGTGNTVLTNMITREWQSAGKSGRPATLAIVDDDPVNQYLYPEMLLAREALQEIGVTALIVDARELAFDGTDLVAHGTGIDMVYNRSTDFTLTLPRNKPLADAARRNAAVISPSPKHHALYADKRNLIEMQNQSFLTRAGLPVEHQSVLKQHIPDTTLVTDNNADQLFSNRRLLFFKPINGYGSRAVYRGDKITKRVWQHITANDYIAQTLVPPSLRSVTESGVEKRLKFDVRIYTAAAKPLLGIARIYQGQTTNFRTAGGGFAPVYSWGPGPHSALPSSDTMCGYECNNIIPDRGMICPLLQSSRP